MIKPMPPFGCSIKLVGTLATSKYRTYSPLMKQFDKTSIYCAVFVHDKSVLFFSENENYGLSRSA